MEKHSLDRQSRGKDSGVGPDAFDITVAPLRELNPLQVHAMYQLRADIFVLEQTCLYRDIDDTDAAPETLHLLALRRADGAHHDSSELLGCARLFPVTGDDIHVELDHQTAGQLANGDRVWQFGRFAVASPARGTGVAQALMHRCIDMHGDELMFLEAQSPLVPYYARFGFEVCGPEFDDAGVMHTPMLRQPA